MQDIKVGELVYNIVSKIDGSVETNIKKVETNVKELGNTMDKTNSKAKSFGDNFRDVAKAIGLVYLTQQIFNFGKASVQAFANAQQSLIQFNNAQQNVAGTTKEQINDLNEYILALEKKTSIDDKSIRQASQILAQDQISIENQKKLLAGIVDLAVANSKANGQEIDVAGTGKAIGLAFAEGNLGRLVKQNVAGITETEKKLFEMGTEAQRTAILMKILDTNAKGAGENLGNSFQGKINRAKDTIEDLQVALGEGLQVGFYALIDNLFSTSKGADELTDKTNGYATSAVRMAGVVGFLGNSLKVVWNIIKYGVLVLGGAVSVFIAFLADLVSTKKALMSVVTGLANAFDLIKKGQFAEAIDSVKSAFDVTVLAGENTKIAIEGVKKSLEDTSIAMKDAQDGLGRSAESMVFAGKVAKEMTAENKKLVEAENAKADALAQSTEQTTEAKQKLEGFNKTLVDTYNQSVKTSEELKGNLTKSFKDFSEKLADNVNETKNRLAEIVVDAEEKRKELLASISKGQADGSDVSADQKELQKVQATLNARVGYEDRASKQIELIRNKIKDAGLDPALLNENLLTSQKSFEDELKLQRDLASKDEFTRFELEQNAKLLKLTESFITEATLIQTKITAQKGFEADLTAFIKSENFKRLTAVEQFASASIAKYGAMADSLRNIISLQNQIKSVGQAKGLPQFHDGGFVGGQGGQVHAGEFVVPANIVASNPSLISALDNLRNQTNNITINTQNTGGNLQTATEELLWKLERV